MTVFTAHKQAGGQIAENEGIYSSFDKAQEALEAYIYEHSRYNILTILEVVVDENKTITVWEWNPHTREWEKEDW